ncbi:MAG: GNAT family N-acetyltransferase [Erysipelotrichaceae bacterium]|jgi:GNAT superfamily N-acetyltransferase
MEYEKLTSDNADNYIKYLKTAMEEEPKMMLAESVDEKLIKERLKDSFFMNTKSILAIDDGNVVGRIEYHFYGCLQDGYRIAYVNWVYVLPKYRHKKIAQGLFKELENDCKDNNIYEYYLIRAENHEADSFYHSFENARLYESPMLSKELNRISGGII